ncbi:MAG TPA: hypothetical protein VJH03_05615, partial [Blastocatellia bacterium]|nr:hypothetical protein [Blastocatellia bacterium]
RPEEPEESGRLNASGDKSLFPTPIHILLSSTTIWVVAQSATQNDHNSGNIGQTSALDFPRQQW